MRFIHVQSIKVYNKQIELNDERMCKSKKKNCEENNGECDGRKY